MKTLDLLAAGKNGFVKSLNGGKRYLSRITAMGFTSDASVTVIRNSRKGPLIVYLRDTEVALGRREASGVEIAEDAV